MAPLEIPGIIQQKTKAAIIGDALSFGDVFEYFRPRLLSHALRICGNSPVAQDAVQDTFISAFTHLNSLRDSQVFYPWLKKILVNNCYLLLRREHSVELHSAHLKSDLFVEQSVQITMEKTADQWQLFDSLRDLSEELRICMLLRYFSNYKSYDSISLLLGLPIGTVRSRLSAAREKLTSAFRSKTDSSDGALKEGENWSGYYREMYNSFYDDLSTRNELLNHHHPELNMRYTSGATGKGRVLLENEVNNDLNFGSRFAPTEIISSGNISVIEGVNLNHEDYPDRCAPRTAMVLFRKNERVETVHIYDSARPVA